MSLYLVFTSDPIPIFNRKEPNVYEIQDKNQELANEMMIPHQQQSFEKFAITQYRWNDCLHPSMFNNWNIQLILNHDDQFFEPVFNPLDFQE